MSIDLVRQYAYTLVSGGANRVGEVYDHELERAAKILNELGEQGWRVISCTASAVGVLVWTLERAGRANDTENRL